MCGTRTEAAASAAPVSKPKKEPGILKRARMELLAEGNRKAASHGLAAQSQASADPSTLPAAASPASHLPSAAPTAEAMTPAAGPSGQADDEHVTPAAAVISAFPAAEAGKSPDTSPGIILRSSFKVRKQPTTAKKARTSSKQTPARQALTAAGAAVAAVTPRLAEAVISPKADGGKATPKKGMGAQTARKPIRAKKGDQRRSL